MKYKNMNAQAPYFEGFLSWFTGADDNEAWSSHAAEAFQVQSLKHRHSGNSIIL